MSSDRKAQSAGQLASWLEEERGVSTTGAVDRNHLRSFISHLVDSRSPATASVRFRALQQFFNWLVDEGEIDASPMSA